MTQKKFKVLYQRKGKFFYFFPIKVASGFEFVLAENLGDAYKQAQHHLEEHGWLSGNFDGWTVAAILEEQEKSLKETLLDNPIVVSGFVRGYRNFRPDATFEEAVKAFEKSLDTTETAFSTQQQSSKEGLNEKEK